MADDIDFEPEDKIDFEPDTAPSIPAPGKSDVSRPTVIEQPDAADKPQPGVFDRFKGAVIGATEGAPGVHILRRAAAGLTALSDIPYSDKSFGENYENYLAASENEKHRAATETPVEYGAGKAGMTTLSAMRMGPLALAGLNATDAAVGTPGDVGDKASAAAQAGISSYLLGKLATGAPNAASGLRGAGEMLPGVARTVASKAADLVGSPSPWLTAATGIGFGAKTAMDPSLPEGERWAGGLSAAAIPAAHAAATGSRLVTKRVGQRMDAEDDLRRVVQSQVDKERADLAEAQRKAFDEGVGSAFRVDRDVNAALADQRKDAKNQASLAKVGRERDYIAEKQAVEAQNAKAQAEHETALAEYNKRQTEIAAAKTEREKAYIIEKQRVRAENAKAQAAYRQSLAEYSRLKDEATQHALTAKNAGTEMKDAARRILDVRKAEEKFRAQHDAEKAGIRKDIAELAAKEQSADASVQGEVGEMHRELFTRLSNVILGAKELRQEVEPEMRDAYAYLWNSLEAKSPAKMKALDDYRADPDAWVKRRAAEKAGDIAAERAGLDQRLASMETPDFRAKAEAAVDAKKAPPTFTAEDMAVLQEHATRLGVDLSKATPADILAGRVTLARPAPQTPAEPALPGRKAMPDRDAMRLADLNAPPIVRPAAPDAVPMPSRDPLRLADLAAQERAIVGGKKDLTPLANDKGASRVRFDAEPSPVNEPGYFERVFNDAIALGRQNVKDTLRSEGVPEDRGLGTQYALEKVKPVASRFVRGVGTGTVGGMVGGPTGAVVGGTAGVMTARRPQDQGLSQFLTESIGNAAKGERAGYKTPAEAVFVRRALEDAARKVPSIEQATSLAVQRGAAASAVLNELTSDPAFRRYIESLIAKRGAP